ncbi:MAG: hypothetical protein KKH72_14845 [Alphaproteobacteria bacterium]|nr:hypothetical protein [Alphaproteobacteria bacterium]
MQPIRRSEKGGHTIYMEVGVWYDSETEHIHLTVPASGWFHTTINNHPGSERRHKNLFGKLARALKDAGAPNPDVPVDEDDEAPRFL